nr:AraC family transcriptional regulator [Panacagrimonas sp.]
MVRNILDVLRHPPGLGLDAGLRYHLSTYGIWGFALLTSPSLRAVAEVVERYLSLSYAFVRFQPRLRADGVQIVLDDSGIEPDVRQFLLERDFAAWANAMREMQAGALILRDVSFRFARPAYAARFTELCGLEPRFGAAENRVTLDPSLMDQPLPQADPVMARMCLEQCRHLLGRRQSRGGYAGRVRDRLFQSAGGMPGLEAVAEELHLSARSLRRHLETEGTTFRALCDEVLETLAEELLTTASMKIDEVAARLGYAESASFIHAFKRWKGVSPNAFREQHRSRT